MNLLDNCYNSYKILVIDDDLFIQMQLRLYLEREGYEVVIVSSGEEGIEAYTKHHPDLVLSDAIMPNMNGFEFVAKVRQHPEYQELPIILVTSLTKDEDKRRGAQVGANAYIVKDQFNQEMLIETLDRLV